MHAFIIAHFLKDNTGILANLFSPRDNKGEKYKIWVFEKKEGFKSTYSLPHFHGVWGLAIDMGDIIQPINASINPPIPHFWDPSLREEH